MDSFNTLLNLPRSAVFAILDEEHKRALVQYSTSLMASLGRIVDRIQIGESVYREFQGRPLKFVVLETDDCRNRLMVRTGFHMSEYRNQGYTLLIDQPPVEYRVKVVPRYVTRHNGAVTSFVLDVLLVSKRNSKILVGTFSSKDECDAFLRLNYSIEKVIDIVYHESVSKVR